MDVSEREIAVVDYKVFCLLSGAVLVNSLGINTLNVSKCSAR